MHSISPFSSDFFLFFFDLLPHNCNYRRLFTHEKASHVTPNSHRVSSLSCLSFTINLALSHSYKFVNKNRKILRRISSRHSRFSVDTLERKIGRRMLGAFRVHIIPGGPQTARGSSVGRLALLIVIPECSALPIRVCFGQVCLSPAETYFSNYHTQLAALPSSLEKSLPLLLDQPPPKRRFALFSPFSSSLSLSLSSCFSVYFAKISTSTQIISLVAVLSVHREMKFNAYSDDALISYRSLSHCVS